jgi:acylphosphatase
MSDIRNLITRHLKITGKVQGVGFRRHTQRKAEELGVHGWVRNRLDGTVEAVMQGPADAVEALVAWAHDGPPKATVIDVKVSAQEAQEHYPSFRTLPTE